MASCTGRRMLGAHPARSPAAAALSSSAATCCPLVAEVRRHVLPDQKANVGERRQRHDAGDDKRSGQRPRPIGGRLTDMGHQCRGPFLSSVTRAIGESIGSSMPPPALHSHSMPASQSHVSARWLVPRHGRAGWFSQTQPVSSQTKHAITDKISRCAAESESVAPTAKQPDQAQIGGVTRSGLAQRRPRAAL
jgi:hypothetical protein